MCCTWQCELGKWGFLGKEFARFYEGYMFPVCVNEGFELWPEQNARQRIWVRLYYIFIVSS